MNKALVTGGTGYVGSLLVPSLIERGIKVRILARDPGKASDVDWLKAQGVEVVEGDITKPETIAGIADGIDTVFHLAAASAGTYEALERTNLEGTRNLIGECMGKVAKFIYASTTSVYGNCDGNTVDESSPANPNTDYSKTKLFAEGSVRNAAAMDDFPGVIVRFGSIYGPTSRLVQDFAAKGGNIKIIGNGKNYANIIRDTDAVAALFAIAESGKPGETYVATDGTPVLTKLFYKSMAEFYGGGKPEFIGTTRIRMVAGILSVIGKMTGMPPVVSVDTVRLLTNSTRVSNGKITGELGFTPKYPSYREGLEVVFKDFH